MPQLTDALREIGDLRRQLLELQTETRANTAEIGTAIRKTRLALAVIEQNEAIGRLRPSTSPIIWDPRTGDMSNPELSQSLIDRLRRGDPVSNSLGGTGLYVGQPNLLLDGVLDTALVAANFSSSWQRASLDFQTRSILLQGSDPPTHYFTGYGGGATFGGRQAGEFMSGPLWGVAAAIATPCTFRHEWFFAPGGDLTYNYDIDKTGPLPFLVAALRFVRTLPAAAPFPTALTGTLEIHADPTNGVGTVVASETWNLLEYGANAPILLSVAAVVADMSAYTHFAVVFKVLDESGSSAGLTYTLYEPQIHYALTPDPVPFSPGISRWQPTWLHSDWLPAVDGVNMHVIRAQLAGESFGRYVVKGDGTTEWGPGGLNSRDTMIARVGTGVLGYESDLIAYDDSSWSFTYNPDGTVNTATRSGEQGAANVTVSYSGPGKVSGVVTTKGGRTITVNPTYTGDKVTALTRAVT